MQKKYRIKMFAPKSHAKKGLSTALRRKEASRNAAQRFKIFRKFQFLRYLRGRDICRDQKLRPGAHDVGVLGVQQFVEQTSLVVAPRLAALHSAREEINCCIDWSGCLE